ncbi:hypothetical protein ISU07_19670 [Nocardioides islandensis]|uniref:Uncharacterized protein n=1 Tax=Nocardioides islandensis TaxID=433663 RepID=A0A930YEG2_9ACTN|nr:hypothetical protein [Nocardioides islandensis]MBF4765356.1 hypothetical protein [Nocardioides islandensis]
MRIVLHAGLHKSGTTSIQEGWRQRYGDPATTDSHTWYPPPPPGPPGHHRLARPLLAAFVDGHAPDLLGASVSYHLRGRSVRQSMADVVAAAEERGVGTLLLSSEDFDRVRPEDTAGLRKVFGGHDLTLVLTLTRPVHRWCASWQTLVRHGMPHYPADGAAYLLEFAALRPGRLVELTEQIPADRSLFRLVRTSPYEPDLAADLAAAVGLPPVAGSPDAEVLNPSLGVDTEVVLRMNRAGLAMGTDEAGQQVLRRLRGDGFSYREAPELAARYALPQALVEAAVAEQEWLGAATVLDPHDVLGTWTDVTVPEWYATISRREAVAPELDDLDDVETMLWRARQEGFAYRKRVERTTGET